MGNPLLVAPLVATPLRGDEEHFMGTHPAHGSASCYPS